VILAAPELEGHPLSVTSEYLLSIHIYQSYREAFVPNAKEMGNAFKIFVRKPRRKRPLERLRRRWSDRIKTDTGKTGCESVD
jgi:hypothetical protein